MTTDFTEFNNSLTNSTYSGGWTNTQQAIEKCTDLIKDETNPVIVLITDGKSTACNPEGSTFHSAGIESLDCDGNGQSTRGAAEEAAEAAWYNGVDIIPVVIDTDSKDVSELQNLSRCKNSIGPCSKYFGIKVEDHDVMTIVDDVIEATNCRDVATAMP